MINPGLFSPSTIVWKIHSDPSMAVGGIRALLQQALHPVAMAGVAAHSNFRDDAWGRLQRTGDYVSTITFGEVEEANKLASRVRAIHTKLGLDDPHYLLWVHMAMVDSFLDTAVRSGLELSDLEKDLYINQMRIFAELVGIPLADVPISMQELIDYFNDIKPELSASDDAKRAALFYLFHQCQKWFALQRLQHRLGQLLQHLPHHHFLHGHDHFMVGRIFPVHKLRHQLL